MHRGGSGWLAASVERGGLGPGSLRGAGFLAVWGGWSQLRPCLEGEEKGGGVRRDPLSKRVRSLHLWCCSLPCFGTVVLCWAMFVWAWACWLGDHVAQLGFLFPRWGLEEEIALSYSQSTTDQRNPYKQGEGKGQSQGKGSFLRGALTVTN